MKSFGWPTSIQKPCRTCGLSGGEKKKECGQIIISFLLKLTRRCNKRRKGRQAYHGIELALLGNLWENLLLNGGRLGLDAVEDLLVEEVNSGVDLIAHPFLRFLDKALDLAVGVRHDNAIFGGLLHFGGLHFVSSR